jgi:hypothetical protein
MKVEGVKTCDVADELTSEFPGLGLLACRATAARSSSSGVVEELDALAQRTTGPTAVRAATQPVAAAYRTLRVGLGVEADSGTNTLEALVRRRLVEGGLRSYGQPADAIAISTFETGVPIEALVAEGGEVSLGVDTTGVVSLIRDGVAVAPLFGEPVSSAVPPKGAERSLLVAVVAPGVLAEVAALALDRARELSAS